MNFLLFINELSYKPPAADIRAAHGRMSLFLGIISCIRYQLRISRLVLRVPDDLDVVDLAEGYPVRLWRNDDSVPRDIRVLFKGIMTQAPCLARGRDGDGSALAAISSLQLRYDGRAVIGLGAACVAEGLSVSFASDDCWNLPLLPLEGERMDEDGKIVNVKCQVRHVSVEQHIESHGEWIDKVDRLVIHDGQSIWDHRAKLFPNLEFCKDVRRQLSEFRGGDSETVPMLQRLLELQECFHAWLTDEKYKDSSFPFEIIPSKHTTESGRTMDQFGKEHTFSRQNGEKIVFREHVRFTPGAGRIFFCPDNSSRNGIVGYVGKCKLPTVNYKT